MNRYVASVAAHLHMFFHLVRAEGLQTGRGSGSPPQRSHSRTDSEPVSKSWNLTQITRLHKNAHGILLYLKCFIPRGEKTHSLAQDASGISMYPLRQ